MSRLIKRRIGRRGRELRVALYLALAAYGVWNGLIFIAWLGFAFLRLPSLYASNGFVQ